MRIMTFKNNKGLIHGTDAKRIGCDIGGTLKIGSAEIAIFPEAETIMPVLFNGCTGEYKASFISDLGHIYELDNVSIQGGRIVPPPRLNTELAELRHRVDTFEDECEYLREQIRILSNIFDTDALNFLIKK